MSEKLEEVLGKILEVVEDIRDMLEGDMDEEEDEDFIDDASIEDSSERKGGG
jgi:hypothetical protein